MTAARKLVRTHYAIGDVSAREESLFMSIECKLCETLLHQQLLERDADGGGETWAVLPCTCKLGAR